MKQDYQARISKAEKQVGEAGKTLQKAREELDKAHADSVLEGDLYEKINEIYINSNNPVIRKKIRNSLERLIKKYELTMNTHFDYEKAKKIRKEAGLSMQELADKLRVVSPVTIYRYEKGELGFSKSRGGGFGSKFKKYLLWLKEEGYNPYNLK